MKRNTLLNSFATAALALSLPAVALASGSYGAPCTTTYGGGYGANQCPQTKFTVDKTVQKPNSADYTDNISVSDNKYGPSSIVNFRIKVRNEGKDVIPTLNVTDTLPQYLDFAISSQGSFTNSSRQLNYTISNLKPGEESVVYVTTKAQENLSTQDTTCVINQVTAKAQDNSTVSDNTQVCLAKGVKSSNTTPNVYPAPVNLKSTPSTGPEALLLPLLFSSGAAGFILRKKAK